MELSSLADVCRHLQRMGRELRSSRGGEVAHCRWAHRGATVAVAMREVGFASGSRWLALSLPVCALERMRPRAALVASGELPIGALAVFEQQVLLRQTLPLGSLAPEALEQTLRTLAETATGMAAAAARTASEPGAGVPWGYLFR